MHFLLFPCSCQSYPGTTSEKYKINERRDWLSKRQMPSTFHSGTTS